MAPHSIDSNLLKSLKIITKAEAKEKISINTRLSSRLLLLSPPPAIIEGLILRRRSSATEKMQMAAIDSSISIGENYVEVRKIHSPAYDENGRFDSTILNLYTPPLPSLSFLHSSLFFCSSLSA